MKKIIDIRAARKAAEKRKYSALVLDAYDDIKHEVNQKQREQAAKIRRKARNAM